MKNLIGVVFILISFGGGSCEVFMRATPVPKEKREFVGKWQSNSGFIIEIKNEGLVDLSNNLTKTDADYEKLCIKVGPSFIKDIFVNFKEDNILQVIKPLVYAKEYKIDQAPYQENNKVMIVLNGVILIKQVTVY